MLFGPNFKNDCVWPSLEMSAVECRGQIKLCAITHSRGLSTGWDELNGKGLYSRDAISKKYPSALIYLFVREKIAILGGEAARRSLGWVMGKTVGFPAKRANLS